MILAKGPGSASLQCRSGTCAVSISASVCHLDIAHAEVPRHHHHLPLHLVLVCHDQAAMCRTMHKPCAIDIDLN